MYTIRERIRSYERRDDEKVRTDKAKNDFESIIYALRDWLNDDNNQAFVKSAENDELMTKLSQEEEWLVDGEGDSANATEY
jgi:hypoxia up-regulated 1